MTQNLTRGGFMPLNLSLNKSIVNTTENFLPPLYNLFRKKIIFLEVKL